MRLRILQAVSYYPPALGFGGPPQVMFSLGKELVKRGHSVTVYTTNLLTPEDWKAKIGEKQQEINGIKIHRFAQLKNGHILPTKFCKLLVTGVDEQWKQDIGSIDVVHVSEITNYIALRCSSLARRANIPYVVSIFGSLTTYTNPVMSGLKKTFIQLWGDRLLRQATALLAQTPNEEKICTERAPRKKIVFMPLAIDMELFQLLPPRGTFRKRYEIGEDEKVVLFLGRLHKYKGAQLLVKVSANLLAKHNYGHKLVIAGSDDGYKSFIQGLVKRLGIEAKVIFTGPIFGEDKLEAYVDADVFVTTPITYEETSLAALEACACNTPVIITERNAIPGLQEHQAGLQIHYDEKELESALLEILEDCVLREKMGENARRLIEREYSLERVVDRLEDLFLNIVRGKMS